MFTLRQHSDDKDMIEIRTRHDMGRIVVWAVVNDDFLNSVIPDQDIRDMIISGEEIEFELVLT